MAGAVGAGGIGALAIDYGYNRFDGSVVTLTVIILLIMVQIIQMIGERLSRLR
jgi:D-methionine transport system permease protein